MPNCLQIVHWPNYKLKPFTNSNWDAHSRSGEHRLCNGLDRLLLPSDLECTYQVQTTITISQFNNTNTAMSYLYKSMFVRLYCVITVKDAVLVKIWGNMSYGTICKTVFLSRNTCKRWHDFPVQEYSSTTTIKTSSQITHNINVISSHNLQLYICKFTRVAIKLIYAVPTVSYGGYIKNFTVCLTQKRVTQSRDFR